jgi:molecular chaperone GrpE
MSDSQNNTDSGPELAATQSAPETAATAAPAEEAPAAPMPAPSAEELLKAAEIKAAEHHDAWLRAKAEAENARRRAQEDVAKASKFAVEKFAEAMLPVKDSLEATLVAESATLESLRAGVELTLKQLVSGLQGSGVKEVNPAGEKFDPHRHQAISALESDGDPNRVLTVLQKGYLLHDRVLRPALVVVSKAKETPAPPAQS